MSIIIANNDENGFYIISDTKLTFNEDKFPCQIKEPLKTNLKKYGTIKTIIINPNVALSFAGDDIQIADDMILVFKNISKPCTSEDIYNIIKNEFNSQKNLNPDGSHKCDFILATVVDNKPSLSVFKDDGCTRNVTRCYIGNSEVYKKYKDYNVSEILANTYSDNDCMHAEISLTFTPIDQKDNVINTMRQQMRRLKGIVDLGCKKDAKHTTDVDSPIIGVYFNTDRKQLEYYHDIIFEMHTTFIPDGIKRPLIDCNTSKEVYEIIPIDYSYGVIIYHHIFDISIIYFRTIDYLNQGIDTYNNLLLPLFAKGEVTRRHLIAHIDP